MNERDVKKLIADKIISTIEESMEILEAYYKEKPAHKDAPIDHKKKQITLFSDDMQA